MCRAKLVLMQILVDKEVVCWSKLGDETLLLNLDTGYYYTLDELGGLIWEMLIEQHDQEKIVERIVSEYEAERKSVESDLKTLLEELQREGMIVIK